MHMLAYYYVDGGKVRIPRLRAAAVIHHDHAAVTPHIHSGVDYNAVCSGAHRIAGVSVDIYAIVESTFTGERV